MSATTKAVLYERELSAIVTVDALLGRTVSALKGLPSELILGSSCHPDWLRLQPAKFVTEVLQEYYSRLARLEHRAGHEENRRRYPTDRTDSIDIARSADLHMS